MDLNNKRVLVLGLGITGLATVKALNHLGARLIVADSKSELELEDFFKEIKNIHIEKYLDGKNVPLEDIDLIVKSPGITPRVEILLEAESRNIEVLTDIELAYRISPTENLIAVTGTNGKTTTTTLVGEICEKANYNTYLAGNIGVGILENIIEAKKDDVFVIEASSFQLDNTVYFKPKISLIINITPDHLDWHGSLDNYIDAKKKILKNQDENDFTVLNYDDKLLREIGNEINSKIIWFSENNELENGVFIQNENVVLKEGQNITKILPVKDIHIVLENALGSIAVSLAMGIDLEIIRETISDFKGLEHRMEYVSTIGGISFYNDSKGTNPESTIMALETINSPIILIAGGHDKGSEFDGIIKAFKGKVRHLILFGDTKEKIRIAAVNQEFKNIHLVNNMKEAVKLSYNLGKDKDNVLLSPACAAWGMYKNFEERGKDFKALVLKLGEKEND